MLRHNANAYIESHAVRKVRAAGTKIPPERRAEAVAYLRNGGSVASFLESLSHPETGPMGQPDGEPVDGATRAPADEGER